MRTQKNLLVFTPVTLFLFAVHGTASARQEAEPEQAPPAEGQPAAEMPAGKGGLRLHVVSTRNTYLPLAYDVFSLETRQVVASGVGAVESRGETPKVWELAPGLYKIVRAGEPFDSRMDFAVASVEEGAVSDFVVVVEPDSLAFRGSGPVRTEELPRGVDIAGVRVSLNGGGNLLFNHKVNPVGTTSGITAQLGLFGNFGLVFDRGNHFVDVGSELQLDLFDPVTGSVAPMRDRFEASALYAYNLNNPYIGPYVRGGFRTRVFPGYLYLETNEPTGVVNINRRDGTTEMRTFGEAANPDALRIRIADPFAPFILQEEIGANLKAVNMDLLLFKLVVSTRLGFGLRQGFTNGLLVVDGSDEGTPVTLNEVANYDTLGPVVGANASVTFARWLFGAARFGMLVPLTNTERAGTSWSRRLLIDLAGTGGFKVPILTNLLFASFDYTFRLERDGYVRRETQFEHSVMARVNVTLF